jgi:exodeoxyribonuclease V gamma subunit
MRLKTSNRVEALADALAEEVAGAQHSFYEPVRLVVPNALVEVWVKQHLARRLGIAANIQSERLSGFLREVARNTAPDVRIVDRDVMCGELLALLHDPTRLRDPELAEVNRYLAAGDVASGLDRRRVQLAGKLADLFDSYAFSRPEMLAAWRKGALVKGLDESLQRWQRAAWLGLFGRGQPLAAAGVATLPDFFERTPADKLRAPEVVHLFGLSYVARLYRSIFASLGRASRLHVYALNPCREFWEDLEPSRRQKRQERRFPRRRAGTQLSLGGTLAPQEEHAQASGEPENPLLERWGKPGRDNIALLNQLADYDDGSRFVDPDGDSLLATLQKGVLDRLPVAARPKADDSVTIVPATDPRRELETVAAEIWRMVRAPSAGPPSRFSDFAVIVPLASAETYLPLARAVFAEASGLPHAVVDLPSGAERRVADAIELLLALPTGPLGRPDLLRLAMHPLMARRFPDVDPEDWLTLADELHIVRGADRRDHEPSYLDHDHLSWDNGLKRLALGAFLSGRPSGEERAFVIDGTPVLPAERRTGVEPAARSFVVWARQLLAFAAEGRASTRPIRDWLALIRAQIATLLVPASGEEDALGDALAALERLSESLPEGLRTSYLAAAELFRERLAERSGAVHRVPEGVTVASFVPMRALPFRTVFVVGLDERVFPSPQGFGTLDLRRTAPRPGDVTPREQDEYMFLETLLSARERLVLSYVARDPVTGDDRGPSSVVLALRDALGETVAQAITRERPPLARHEHDDACAVIPAAARERQAAALGGSLRRAAGVIQLPPAAQLRGLLAPEVGATLANILGWQDLGAHDARARSDRTSLTLADLRRFLECPLQGSVRALLPMRDDDEAADEAESAERENERLDEARVETVPLLRAVLIAAAAEGASDDALARAYDAAAAIRRLDGTLPSGLFGRSLRARHLRLLRCWANGLRSTFGLAPDAPLPHPIAARWFGAAPEHRRDVHVEPGIPIPITRRGEPATVMLTGQTELLARVRGDLMSIQLLSSSTRDYVDRDLFRSWLTHLALAASGEPPAPLRALLVRPEIPGGETARVDDIWLPAITPEDARAELGALAEDMLENVHPYLLPCEGVLTWKRRRMKGEDMTIRQAVLMVRDDGWTRLSSKFGPVPDALSYPVPPDAVAETFVRRRFDRFFTVAPVANRQANK